MVEGVPDVLRPLLEPGRHHGRSSQQRRRSRRRSTRADANTSTGRRAAVITERSATVCRVRQGASAWRCRSRFDDAVGGASSAGHAFGVLVVLMPQVALAVAGWTRRILGILDPAWAYGRAVRSPTTRRCPGGVLPADDRLERGVGLPPGNLVYCRSSRVASVAPALAFVRREHGGSGGSSGCDGGVVDRALPWTA